MIKIFMLDDSGEFFWFAAETLDEAKTFARTWLPEFMEYENDDDVDEVVDRGKWRDVQDAELNRLEFIDEDNQFTTGRNDYPTFREVLDQRIARGDKFPDHFAMSMY
jgi:hypothetical protein